MGYCMDAGCDVAADSFPIAEGLCVCWGGGKKFFSGPQVLLNGVLYRRWHHMGRMCAGSQVWLQRCCVPVKCLHAGLQEMNCQLFVKGGKHWGCGRLGCEPYTTPFLAGGIGCGCYVFQLFK